MTDRVGGTCHHRRCPPGDCQTYAEVQPSEEDLEFGRRLVKEGWFSTSGRYRHVARWLEPVPSIEELFRPEMLESFHGRRLADVLRNHLKWHFNCRTNGEDQEMMTLTLCQFRAFKMAGGDCAR